MNQSQDVKDLFTALSKAQGEIRGALKDSSNPFFKSKYADLESVWEACRPSLVKNGLSVAQTTEYIEGAGICVVTTLGHTSGQWIKGSLPIMAKSQDPQGVGSAITYARRYALAAIVGVVQVDDDAEAAMSRGVKPEQPAEGDGHNIDRGYMIPFGKWAKRSLEEVHRNHGTEAIADYMDYLADSAKKQNKPVAGQVKEFIDNARVFLRAVEGVHTEAGRY
jgi:hypothetical protein